MKIKVYICKRVCPDCISVFKCPFSIPRLIQQIYPESICPRLPRSLIRLELYWLSVNFNELSYKY